MGIVSERRRKERMRCWKRRTLIAVCAAFFCFAAMSDPLREKLMAYAAAGLRSAQAFAGGERASAELTLPRREIYALQLAVFDSGERAAEEAQRLQAAGIRCIVWQREKMRIVSSVALAREALDAGDAQQETYVIKDIMPEVSMRITAEAGHMDEIQALLTLPDSTLVSLLHTEKREPLETVIADVWHRAAAALSAHPECAVYTQLAQSLVNWCALMEETMDEADEAQARSYAAVTMCTLCRELRQAILAQPASEASTASAQRMPSTAAEVMPPA